MHHDKWALAEIWRVEKEITLDAFLRAGDSVLKPSLSAKQYRALRRQLSMFLERRMQSPAPRAVPWPSTPDGLHEWAASHHLEHLMDRPLSEAPFVVSPSLLGLTVASRTIAEVMTTTIDALPAPARMDDVRAQLWTRLAAHAEQQKRGFEEERQDDYLGRTLPEDPTAAALIERLRTVRAQLREVQHPRAKDYVTTDRVQVVDGNPPVFRYSELRGPVARPAYVQVPLTLDPDFDLTPTCSCCNTPCAHALSAIDTLLETLFGEGDACHRAAILRGASTTPWKRWLDTLDRALLEMEASKDDRQATQLWWQLDFEGIRVTPYVQKRGKRGTLLKPKQVPLEEVEQSVDLSRADRLTLASAHLLRLETRPHRHDAGVERAFFKTVDTLIGHPRVLVDAPPSAPWQVVEAQIAMKVAPQGERLDLDLRVGRSPASARDAYAAWKNGHPFVRILYEERTIEVTRIDRPLAALIRHWEDDAVPIPRSAEAVLLERVSRASLHVPVVASDVVTERVVEPRVDIVLLLTPLPAEAGLLVEARVRPIARGPLFSPGLGPEETVSSTPDRQILRTTRDHAQERAIAGAVLGELMADHPFSEGWTVTLEGVAEALEVVARLRDDPRVECQWPGHEWKIEGSVSARQVRLRVASKRDWFGLSGEARADGRRMELAVLLEAARRDRGWVRLEGGGFVKLEETLAAQLRDLAPYVGPHKRSLKVSKAAATLVDALGQTVGAYRPDEPWSNLVERVKRAPHFRPIPPRHLADILRPYQREGFEWLSRLATWGAGGVLADDMGLGKTLQAIAVLETRADQGAQLVVAPTSVCFNWQRELTRFGAALTPITYAGPERTQHLDTLGPGKVMIASYGIVQRDAGPLASHRFATLVLDEAQAVKNAKSERSRAIRTLDADWTFALTGTPVENHPGELWALFAAVFPGALGSWEQFRTRFIGTEQDGVAFGTAALSKVVRPFILRRTKAQVATELPPRTEIDIDVVLGRRERALYEDARLAAVAELEGHEVVDQARYHLKVLAALTRLRQLACHPRLVDANSRVPSSKLERLLGIVVDLVEEGRRALVFSQFTKHLALVREALDEQGLPFAYLDGSTPPKARAVEVDRFQAKEVPLFLISLKAGGTGLNLTAADSVIHLDPWWNPAVEDQATDRAHRIGQVQPVTVMRLVARDTIEERILELHAEKRRLVADLLDGTERTAKLSTAELLALMRT